MCYDRTSVGKRPMCATVCPSQALFYGTREQVAALRPQSTPVNEFRFGEQRITTRVSVLVPRTRPPEIVDVAAALDDATRPRAVRLPVLRDVADPFADVEV
jgi:Fe-S-cluster-containing dehydrogenase component